MEPTASAVRRWPHLDLAIVCLIGLCLFGAVGLIMHRYSVHMSWFRRIQFDILRLARKRPDSATPAQWAQCLATTWNLHQNYGPPGYFAEDRREEFAAELERRLGGVVTLDTVDWIWDEYERYAPRAKSYDRFRPTTAAMLQQATELERSGREKSLEEWVRMLDESESLRAR